MATATRTTLSSSVTSMDDASIQEFRAAQDRRFQALQGQPQPYPGPPLPSKDPMSFKNAQADSFRANHSHSPPLKQQHKGRSMSVGGYPQPRNASGDTIQRYDALSVAYDETAKRFMHNYNQLDPANRHAIEAHAAANANTNASIAASAGAALTRARTMNSVRASSILTQQTATAQANLGLLEMQMRQAEEEIARARETVRGLEAQRDDAERAASHAKKVVRRLRAENLVLVAREKGRREGFETGFGHGKALAIARVERERERRRVAAEEMARRRMLEPAPMPPPQGAFIEQVDEVAVVQMPEPEPAPASDPAQEPTRRSSLRRPTTAPPPADNQTVTVQRDPAGGPDITVIINNPPQAQTMERSRTVSSTESASTERNATTRQASTAPRSASRVSIVEPPRERNTPAAPNRSSSVRSSATRDPRRQSTAPSALTSLDSLGVGTPRGMPMEVLMPRMPVAPPMQPQPPAGWVYPDSAEPIPSASTSTAHIPMRPPPGHVPAPISAIELVRPVYNPNPIYPNTAAGPPPDRRDTRTPTSSSSVSTSIRNLHLTNFPTNGAGENRKRELSVIMESHAEGTPSASGSGWTPPYAVPGGSDMDTWRRGSASGSEVGVAPPTASVEMPVVPPNVPPVQVHLQHQQPAPWPYAPPTNPTSMLGPHGPPRPGSDAPPQPTPSTLHRSSSGSTVEITIEPPSRSASAGLRAHEYDDDDDDDEEDEDHPPPGFVPNNPLPVFARGVPPTGPSQSHPAISGGTPLSIPPGAVTGGTASGFVTEPGRSRPPSGPFPAPGHGRTPSFGAGPSTPGFTVEPGRPPSRLANQPSHSTTPIIPGGAPPTSMFTTEPVNRPPSRQMGGILGSGVSPAVAASWENGQPAGIVRPSSRQGNANANGNAPGIYAPNPNAASAWGAPTPTVAGWGNILVGQTAEMPRPPSSQGRSLYAPNPSAGAMNSFTVEPGRGRAEPLLGTSPTPNAGFGAFNVEPGRPPSRMGAEIPRPASRQGGAAHGGGARAMGPQFGFGQDAQRSAPATFNYAVPGSAYGAGPTAPQPTRPQAFTGNDRAQGTTLPSIYGPPAPVAAPTYPATQPVPFIPPSIPSSTTTTSHRRRPSGDAGITPGPASASRNRDLENSSSRRTSLSSSTSRGGVGRRQNNQTPHPGANLGRSNPYDQLDDDEGDDMSSLGMATLQNTFQNSGAARRASVYGGAGSMGGASPALSYHPLG